MRGVDRITLSLTVLQLSAILKMVTPAVMQVDGAPSVLTTFMGVSN